MHRSGTSALSGTLGLLGLEMPATLAPADHNNERGYFESKALWAVNDDLLEAAGSAWNDWTPVDPAALPDEAYQCALERAVEGIRAEFFPSERPFVLKDPRMCRLVPLWLEALARTGCAVRILHTHRNPQEVAASLARRDGFDPAFGMLMWLRHVLDAEYATRGLPRVFTSYRHLMQDWRALAGAVMDGLGIGLDVAAAEQAGAVEGFLSGQLRHFNDKTADTLSNPALPQNIRETFAIMEGWTGTGERGEDHPRLDALRRELDGLALAFGPLVRPGQMALLAGAELEARAQAVEDLSRKVEAVCAERDALQAEMLRLQRDIQARDSSLGALARAIENLRSDRV